MSSRRCGRNSGPAGGPSVYPEPGGLSGRSRARPERRGSGGSSLVRRIRSGLTPKAVTERLSQEPVALAEPRRGCRAVRHPPLLRPVPGFRPPPRGCRPPPRPSPRIIVRLPFVSASRHANAENTAGPEDADDREHEDELVSTARAATRVGSAATIPMPTGVAHDMTDVPARHALPSASHGSRNSPPRLHDERHERAVQTSRVWTSSAIVSVRLTTARAIWEAARERWTATGDEELPQHAQITAEGTVARAVRAVRCLREPRPDRRSAPRREGRSWEGAPRRTPPL